MTDSKMYGAFENTDSFAHALNNKIQLVLSKKFNKPYDNLPVFGDVVSVEELEMFCREMNNVRQSCAPRDGYKKSIEVEDVERLRLVYKVNGKLVPTIGLSLLMGKTIEGINTKIRCVILKDGIAEEKVFVGKLCKQLEDICNFIIGSFDLNNTVDVEGRFVLIPEPVIKELVCNAICHRDYLSDKDIEIVLDEDKLIITNPCANLTERVLTSIKEGYGKIRNRTIMNTLAYKNVVHNFGSGVQSVLCNCKLFGMPEPRFSLDGDVFKVEVFRNKKSGLN